MGRYAVILVMTMVLALFIYGSGLQSNLNVAQQQMVEDFSRSQAGNIANSVTMIAVRKISDPDDDSFTPNSGDTYEYPEDGGFEQWQDMKGEYQIEVYNQGDTLMSVTATARVDEQSHTTEVQMFSGGSKWNPNLPYAVFSGTGITLQGSASIIGHAGTNAIAANSVDLSWATSIDSSLSIGPGGNPSEVVVEANFKDGNVGKNIGNLPTPMDYPLPKFPGMPQNTTPTGSIDLPYGSSTITPASYEGAYIPKLTLRGNSTLTIETGGKDQKLYVGDLDIQQGHLKFEGGGNVEIFVEDQLTLGGSSTLNDGRDQDKAFVYHEGANTLDFGGSTNFNAGIYTKEADVNITGSGGIQGNIITGGDNVTISGNADANSRSIFAPNAYVEVTGSGVSRGAVVADEFVASGNGKVHYSQNFDSSLPDLESQEKQYKISYWK